MDNPVEDKGLAAFIGQRDDLIALACSVVGSRHIAEELVQDSWLRWIRHSYCTEDSRPVLMQIVRNLSLDWYRKRRREADHLAAMIPEQEAEPDTERVVIARQQLGLAVKALESLPERTLLAFRLSRVDGLTLRQIGDRLGVSEVRAHQLVSKALVHVIETLESAS